MESSRSQFDILINQGVFRIPEYQRYYSWEEQQHEDLWTDLRTIGDKPHYFGTFVVQETEETVPVRTPFASGDEDGEKMMVFKLIDGQQRITTVAILMRAIVDALQGVKQELDERRRNELENEIEEIEETFIRYRNVFRIKLLDRDSNHLEAILSSGNDDEDITIDSPSQQRLWDAKEFYDKHIEDLRESECADIDEFVTECLRLKRTVENFDSMVYAIDSDNPERATVIFESVNARGISLSTLDKTKSFLMHMAYTVADQVPERDRDKDLFELVEAIRRRFGDIYTFHQDISQNEYGGFDEATIQRYHFIQYFNWTDKDNHSKSQLLDTLKEEVRRLQRKDPATCYEFLDDYSESLRRAYATMESVLTYEGNPEVEALVERMHALGDMAKFYPWFIAVWPTLDDDEERRIFCKTVETYLLRVYAVGKKDSHTGRAKLYRLVRDVENDNPPTVDSPSDLPGDETVPARLSGYVSTIDSVMSDYQDDSSFERSLTLNNTYERMSSKDLRYLLYIYSIKRSDGEGEPLDIDLDQILSNSYTIEHIWPRSPGDDEMSLEKRYPLESANEYPSIKDRYEEHVHRLGNLTIASRSWNSKWGDSDFATKREKYRDSGLWAQKEIAKQYDDWSLENIDAREESLVDEILDIWPSPRLMLKR